MGTYLRLAYHHQFLAADLSLGSIDVCPCFPESNSRLARVSTGQCLKFCYDIQFFAMPSTLNNSQDLGPEYLKASFHAVKWTLTDGSACKRLQCGVSDRCDGAPSILASCWNTSYHSKNSKCSAVIHVWLCVITVIGSLYCSFWSRSVLPSFETAAALKKC